MKPIIRAWTPAAAHPAPGAALRLRIAALRARLGRRLLVHRVHRRAAGRGTGHAGALERVMRRSVLRTAPWPGLQVKLLAHLSTAIVRYAERFPVPQPRLPAPVQAIRLQVRVVAARQLLRERLYERLAAAPVPAAAGAAPALRRAAGAARVIRRQPAARIEPVMVRSQAPAAPAAAAMAGAAGAVPGRTRPGAAQPPCAPPAPPLVLAAPELARLTDHVIRQLDRRALSWQERTGRV